jgi:hypothetical protein
VTLPQLGRFDLVTTVYLLNDATSQDRLLGMFRSAYDNLVPGGRFIAYTVNPAFTLSRPNSTKYGVTMLHQVLEEDRSMCDFEFVTDPPTPYRHPSGVGPLMSGRSRRPGSGRSPGTLRRSRPKTSRITGRHIGAISTIIAWSSGWSAKSDWGAPSQRHMPSREGLGTA